MAGQRAVVRVALVGRKAAGTWAVLSFAAGAGVVAANMLGWNMPPYPHSWHPVINAAGYLALIVFMFLLGHHFEGGRTCLRPDDRCQRQARHVQRTTRASESGEERVPRYRSARSQKIH